MIEFKTNKPEISLTLDGRGKVTFLCPRSKLKALDGLKDGDYELTIDKHKEKRSLLANAYAWALIGKIADELRASKDEIYLEMLKSYGQSAKVSLSADVDVSGFFKYYEYLGESLLNGVPFKHYKVYKGSSEFDTREMSVFIDGIVYEAKELDIDTRTPGEIALMTEAWGR